MNVLHVSLSDSGGHGGGAIAMYRLHRALRAAGVSSRILARHTTLDPAESTALPSPSRAERLIRPLTRAGGLHDVHLLQSFGAGRWPAVRAADVVHLHIIHSGVFSYLALPVLARGRGLVLTLHDMWPLTGHCIFSYDCERWRTGCGHCPYPDRYVAVRRDASALEWRLKARTYARLRLEVIAPSRWMVECARASLLRRFPIHHIPYLIDTGSYQPRDRQACRHALDLPKDRRLVLFAAAGLDDFRKGGDVLLAALELVPATLRRETVLLTLGPGRPDGNVPAGIEIRSMGVVSDDDVKAAIYCAADVLVCPSRADNLPLVVLEGLACGVPTVATAVGGMSDLVQDGEAGLLVPPDDPVALAQALETLLGDTGLAARLGGRGRALVVEHHAPEILVPRHLAVYEAAQTAAAGVP